MNMSPKVFVLLRLNVPMSQNMHVYKATPLTLSAFTCNKTINRLNALFKNTWGAFHSTQNSGNFSWFIKWNGPFRFADRNIRDQERLPFVWNCPEIPGRIQMERFIPLEIFQKKSNTFRGITFFPFLSKRLKFSVPFIWITNARLHVERKRKIYRNFVHGTTQSRFCIPVPFDGNFSPKFPYKW